MIETKFKETEIGKIPEDWEILPLESHSEYVNRGGPPSYVENNGVTVLNQKCVRGIYVDFSESRLTDPTKKKIPNEKYLSPFDILINSTGTGTLGRVSQIYEMKSPATVDSHVTIVRPKKNTIDPVFLAYYLIRIKAKIEDLAEGSTGQVELPRDKIKEILVPTPTLCEQHTIAKILSDLDAKIELNKQMNTTLESIAETLFKHWFIDFEFPNEQGKPYKSSGGKTIESELGEIPEGWKIGSLNEIVDNKKIPLKPGEHLSDRKYVPIDCLPMKKIGFETYESYTAAQSSLIAFEKDDILLGAMRVYFHRVNLSPFAGITRTTTFVLRPKSKYLLSYVLFILNQDKTIAFANAHSKGSTMPYAVWENSLANLAILIPNDKIIENFHNLCYPLLSKIRDSIFERQDLIQLRDSLLPKLMSGEIRIPIEGVL